MPPIEIPEAPSDAGLIGMRDQLYAKFTELVEHPENITNEELLAICRGLFYIAMGMSG